MIPATGCDSRCIRGVSIATIFAIPPLPRQPRGKTLQLMLIISKSRINGADMLDPEQGIEILFSLQLFQMQENLADLFNRATESAAGKGSRAISPTTALPLNLSFFISRFIWLAGNNLVCAIRSFQDIRFMSQPDMILLPETAVASRSYRPAGGFIPCPLSPPPFPSYRPRSKYLLP